MRNRGKITYTLILICCLILPICSKFKFRKQFHHKKHYHQSSSSSSSCQCQCHEPRSDRQFPSHQHTQVPNITQELVETDQEERLVCNRKPFYDYNILVLMWPIEYCAETDECNDEWKEEWDYKSPLLRGFWPASGDPYYYDCFADSDSQGDPSCQNQAFLKAEQISNFLLENEDILSQLRETWNPYPKEAFDEYLQGEWVKHGSCYLMNMIEDNKKIYEQNEEAFNRTVLGEYFKNGMGKVRKLDLSLFRGQEFYSKEDFAREIGFEGREDHFNLICGDDNEIDEIHICYNRTKIPGKEISVQCPDYDNCQRYRSFRLP